MKKIILAGGCFWGVEAYFMRLKGIIRTRVGYTDGEGTHPTYEEVCNASGHVEAVFIEYDETQISTEKVLEHFFRIINPTERNRQGNDFGVQYRSAIFVFDDETEATAKRYLEVIQPRYKRPIQTYVKQANDFYEAEDYHQAYLKKNPTGYCHVDLQLAEEDEVNHAIWF